MDQKQRKDYISKSGVHQKTHSYKVQYGIQENMTYRADTRSLN